jgi:hypothetical protein
MGFSSQTSPSVTSASNSLAGSDSAFSSASLTVQPGGAASRRFLSSLYAAVSLSAADTNARAVNLFAVFAWLLQQFSFVFQLLFPDSHADFSQHWFAAICAMFRVSPFLSSLTSYYVAISACVLAVVFSITVLAVNAIRSTRQRHSKPPTLKKIRSLTILGTRAFLVPVLAVLFQGAQVAIAPTNTDPELFSSRAATIALGILCALTGLVAFAVAATLVYLAQAVSISAALQDNTVSVFGSFDLVNISGKLLVTSAFAVLHTVDSSPVPTICKTALLVVALFATFVIISTPPAVLIVANLLLGVVTGAALGFSVSTLASSPTIALCAVLAAVCAVAVLAGVYFKERAVRERLWTSAVNACRSFELTPSSANGSGRIDLRFRSDAHMATRHVVGRVSRLIQSALEAASHEPTQILGLEDLDEALHRSLEGAAADMDFSRESVVLHSEAAPGIDGAIARLRQESLASQSLQRHNSLPQKLFSPATAAPSVSLDTLRDWAVGVAPEKLDEEAFKAVLSCDAIKADVRVALLIWQAAMSRWPGDISILVGYASFVTLCRKELQHDSLRRLESALVNVRRHRPSYAAFGRNSKSKLIRAFGTCYAYRLRQHIVQEGSSVSGGDLVSALSYRRNLAVATRSQKVAKKRMARFWAMVLNLQRAHDAQGDIDTSLARELLDLSSKLQESIKATDTAYEELLRTATPSVVRSYAGYLSTVLHDELQAAKYETLASDLEESQSHGSSNPTAVAPRIKDTATLAAHGEAETATAPLTDEEEDEDAFADSLDSRASGISAKTTLVVVFCTTLIILAAVYARFEFISSSASDWDVSARALFANNDNAWFALILADMAQYYLLSGEEHDAKFLYATSSFAQACAHFLYWGIDPRDTTAVIISSYVPLLLFHFPPPPLLSADADLPPLLIPPC